MRSDLLSQGLEETRCCFVISVDSQVRQYKRSHQPAPHRPLVISSVALARGTSVVPLIARLFLGQAAHPMDWTTLITPSTNGGIASILPSNVFCSLRIKSLLSNSHVGRVFAIWAPSNLLPQSSAALRGVRYHWPGCKS